MTDEERKRAVRRIARNILANVPLEQGVTFDELVQMVEKMPDDKLEQELAEIAAVEEYYRQRREGGA